MLSLGLAYFIVMIVVCRNAKGVSTFYNHYKEKYFGNI